MTMKGQKSKAGSGKTEKLAIRKQKVKRVKDPNKPKRPPSAFLLFMEVFREEYRKQHPDNKRVGVVGRAAGDKWRSMSEEEKAPYIDKAEEKKEDYEKQMTAYNEKSKQENDEHSE
ncbi:HMG1/2-like protein isoform X2 [Ipomoea triloba]|uniref:HMG1/2-like protein isoform X1 n=1 Tax=Ipomoea triloba TaxID=35885 RepID=UPI00125DB4C5|nr:HMG1/2-like protein isoform X1 [Ipomoea triloba]XP_031103002.1 HMG1/2-like protein isoform X2 [Ipomoea triloba]